MFRFFSTVRVCTRTLIGVVCLAPTLAGAQNFQPLGVLHGFTQAGPDVPKLSADGTVIVGSVCCNGNANGSPQAFKQTFDRSSGVLGAPVALTHGGLSDTSGKVPWSSALDVSDASLGTPIIVGRGSVYQPPFPGNQTNEAVRWTAPGSMGGLGFLPGRGVSGAGSVAYGVNAGVPNGAAGGSVIVGSTDTTPVGQAGGDVLEAFIWTSARGMQGLGFLPYDTYSIASAVNADGSVAVGGSCLNGSTTASCQPFRWTTTTGMVSLGFLAGYFVSGAYGVSADGSVIVGPACNVTNVRSCQAFRWTASTGVVAIGSGIAYATDAAGDVVVGSTMDGQGNATDAFIWTITGMQSITHILTLHGINLTGWKLTAATGVSADGTTIVGQGSYNGQIANWVAYLPPASAKTYKITVSASPSAYGTVTGAGTYAAGSLRTVNATAKAGFVFLNWTSEGRVVSSSSSDTFVLTNNVNLVANFATAYRIALSVSPSGAGVVSGAGTFAAKTSRTVAAMAGNGYVFDNWTEGGNVVSSSPSYTFTLTGNRTLVANFRSQYTISVRANPPAGGKVVGGGTFTAGSSQTVTATANGGYVFANWTEEGTSSVPRQSIPLHLQRTEIWSRTSSSNSR